MRQIIFLILFLPIVSSAQINSEVSYYFNDDIDTLLRQLQQNKFKNFEVTIKNKNAPNKKEFFAYQRLNDTLLKVNVETKKQYYHFDFRSNRYQALDSLMRPYTYPDFYQTKKDSSGYHVYRGYNIKKQDTTLSYYMLSKTDPQNRITYHFNSNGQHNRTQEIIYSSSADTLITTNISKMETGQSALLSNDTTITKIYLSGDTKTVYKTVRSQSFITNSLRRIHFDKNKTIKTVDYSEKSSNGRNPKATMSVIIK